MPARAADRDLTNADAETDIAPQTQASDATSFTEQGEVPAVSEAQPPQEATASELAYDQSNLAVLDQGMHEPQEYKAVCEASGKPDRWDPKYAAGHTAATQWVQPYEGFEPMQWALKTGRSASEAVSDFLKGPTIADYRVIGVAVEMDELRDNLGDQRFDSLFGSRDSKQDAAIPHDQRLKITSDMYTTPFADQMKAIAAKADEPDVAPDEPVLPPPVEEQREEQPKQAAVEEEAPIVVAEDLGKQPEREVV
jgi:hypothetical protein